MSIEHMVEMNDHRLQQAEAKQEAEEEARATFITDYVNDNWQASARDKDWLIEALDLHSEDEMIAALANYALTGDAKDIGTQIHKIVEAELTAEAEDAFNEMIERNKDHY